MHAIAFADKEELKGKYLDTSPDNLPERHDDLLLFVHRAVPPGGAADDRRRQPVTLTYLGDADA